MRDSASSSASDWARWTMRSSSGWVSGVCGWSRRTVRIEVVPLTSSPAMPITAEPGCRPAICSASSSAWRQLATTASMSLTVPDCMWVRPCRCRPTPRTTPVSTPSRSSSATTSALANSVPTSSAVSACGPLLAPTARA